MNTDHLPRYGDFHYKIRRSWDRLIFIMGIPIQRSSKMASLCWDDPQSVISNHWQLNCWFNSLFGQTPRKSPKRLHEPLLPYHQFYSLEKYQWNFDWNAKFFLNENEFEIGISKMSATFFRPQYVNHNFLIPKECVPSSLRRTHTTLKHSWNKSVSMATQA